MAQKKSAFDTPWFNAQGNDFFNSLNKSRNYNVLLTAETEDFDEETAQQWRDEGFRTAYVPLLGGGNAYIKRVHEAGDSFGVSEYYGIVAFGQAASLILQAHTKPQHPKLVGVVAYYPTAIPAATTKYPASIRVVAHLVGAQIQIQHHPEVLGIQTNKPKTVTKRLDAGAGYGEPLGLAFKAYTYSGIHEGFAERDLDGYDAVAESLAFTRSLEVMRRAFRWETEVDRSRDQLVDLAVSGQAEKAVGRMRECAHVIYGPTLAGGVGAPDLARFYTAFFRPLPGDFRARLLSRTVGADGSQLVDELLISFTHADKIEWILPGIPATGKKVEVVMVSVVRMMGGRLESERVYWDQASVLMQVGLLSPEMVPAGMKKQGVQELPIWGAESARAMKRGSSTHMNELIEGWDE